MPLSVQDISALPTASRYTFLAALLQVAGSRTVLELGVWKGELAAHLLSSLSQIERYYLLDPWRNLENWDKPFNLDDQAFEGVYNQALQATQFAEPRRHILRGTTAEVIHQIPDQTLDAAYIDGDHTLRGITIDLMAVWPKVKTGGLVICDDFTPSPWQHGREYEPSLVFPYALHFAEAVDATAVAPGLNQCVLIKGQGGYAFHDLTGLYGNQTLLTLRGRSFWKRLSGKRT